MEAQIIVSINGQEAASPVGDCKKGFEVKEVPVVPVYECTSLELIKNSRDTYEFKTTATAEGGATIKNVTVDFGDSKQQVVNYGTNASHTYAPGTYTATSTVTFMVNGAEVSKSSAACKVAVSVEQPPVTECKPGIPVGDVRCTVTPTPPELPKTGAGDTIAPLFGLGSLIASIGYYVASRRATIGL
jgi:LPXTG-motif cell wall-anchored protein